MDKRKAIDHYLTEIAEGRKDFGQARSEMEKLGFAKEDIDLIIRYVDDKLISGDFRKTQRGHQREYFLVGLFLFVAGLIATLGTYFGIIDTGNVYIITYGPIIGGLALMVGYKPQRK